MTMTLKTYPRDTYNKETMILAAVHGPKTPSQSMVVMRKDFEALLKKSSESTIITLEGLEKPLDVLIQDMMFRSKIGGVHHVDFLAIEKGKDMTTHVALEFVGEAPVEAMGGTVTKVMYQLEVTCKPKDLPEHIVVDISALKAAGDKIHVSDLKKIPGVTIETGAEEVLAVAEGERAEEPETVPEEASTEPEAVSKEE
ncbi:MAG: 50S ribosomal protein L25 [Patescibacteria group bacterium]